MHRYLNPLDDERSTEAEMKNLYLKMFIVAAIFVSGSIAGINAEAKKPVIPQRFTLNASPQEVLMSYPLDSISRQIAFSHHGSAHRRIKLSNGNQAWVYNVGEKEWHRTYTLVFNDKEFVTDVLYYDHAKHADTGLSALQLQSKPLIVGGPRTGPGPATK